MIRTRGLAMIGLCLGATSQLGAAPPVTSKTALDELKPHYVNKPKSESYTHEMLELGMRMGAMLVDATRKDPTQAKKSLESFRKQYDKVAKMVPTWRNHFPTAPIDELKHAIERNQSPRQKQKIMERIQETCTKCHVREMFPVQTRFRWGQFSEVAAESDDGKNVSLHRIMLDIANGLGAIRNDVSSNRFRDAKQVYGRVKERFTLLELACTECHAQPREYFIDSRVKGKLLRIGGLLRKGSKDVGRYNRLLNEINETSCFPCHQVHMPAAYLQEHWRRQEK